MSDTTPDTTPRPLLLVAALQDELEPLVKKLKLGGQPGRWEGRAANHEIRALATGIGADRAVEVVSKAIDEHQPQVIVLLGLAGGLAPSLKVGDVLEFGEVIDESHNRWMLSRDAPPQTVTQPSPDARRILSLDRLLEKPEEKAAWHEKSQADAVDMESAALAALAAGRGLPMWIIRAISDAADTALPAITLRFVRPDGSVDVGSAMTYIATHPWLMPRFMALQRAASTATEALATTVADMLAAISDTPSPPSNE